MGKCSRIPEMSSDLKKVRGLVNVLQDKVKQQTPTSDVISSLDWNFIDTVTARNCFRSVEKNVNEFIFESDILFNILFNNQHLRCWSGNIEQVQSTWNIL